MFVSLGTAEISLMRGTIDSALPGTAVVHTATKTADEMGGFTWAYAASGTVIARLSPNGAADEPVVGDRVARVAPYVLTLPAETTIDEDDRVVYDGVTYEVVDVRDRTPWELSRRVLVEEVD